MGYSALFATAAAYAVGALAMALTSLYYVGAHEVGVFGLDAESVGVIVYSAVVCSAFVRVS